MYKLIACDLDETLLNDNKEICERNIKAIQKAEREFGVKFIPATGRGYTCIDNVLKTLQVNNKSGEYTISNNGGVISENK
ncbi:MAG: HAD-IIB family hydrolase, partial [Longicatena sp.]